MVPPSSSPWPGQRIRQRKKGSDTILSYLRGLFEDGNFDQGK